MAFKSEKEMQTWLSDLFKKGHCLAEIVINYEDFRKNKHHENYPVSSYQKIIQSFQHCLNSFENHEVLSEDVNISLNPGEMGLKIVDPLIIFKEQMIPSISAKQLGGYQICLYDDQILEGGDYMRLEEYEDSMRAALNAMSAKGNSLKANGFAFLWRHCFDVGLAPYNITVINFASFQTPSLTTRNPLIQKSDFGKRLKKVVRDYDPEGHSRTLDVIADYGEIFLKEFCSPKVEGYSNWETLKPRIFTNTDALAFIGWGIFQDRLFDRLRLMPKHEEADFRFESTDPLFAIEMLKEIIKEN